MKNNNNNDNNNILNKFPQIESEEGSMYIDFTLKAGSDISSNKEKTEKIAATSNNNNNILRQPTRKIEIK